MNCCCRRSLVVTFNFLTDLSCYTQVDLLIEIESSIFLLPDRNGRIGWIFWKLAPKSSVTNPRGINFKSITPAKDAIEDGTDINFWNQVPATDCTFAIESHDSDAFQ